MKHRINAVTLFVIFFSLLNFIEALAQTDLLYDRQITQCYQPGTYEPNSPGGCSTTLEQWYSPIFNDSYWNLQVECDDGSSASWQGNGVWSGSACGGQVGNGGGSSGNDPLFNDDLMNGGVDIEINYGGDDN